MRYRSFFKIIPQVTYTVIIHDNKYCPKDFFVLQGSFLDIFMLLLDNCESFRCGAAGRVPASVRSPAVSHNISGVPRGSVVYALLETTTLECIGSLYMYPAPESYIRMQPKVPGLL